MNTANPVTQLHHFRTTQPDSGTTLLLLHGAGGSRAVWPREMLDLPETTTIALDLPGHGRSPLPGRRTIGQYADTVAAFVTVQGLQDVVLAGHSMGGAIALDLARRKMPSLRGLVLLGAASRMRVGTKLFALLGTDYAQVVEFISNLCFAVESPALLRQMCADELLACDPLVTTGDFMACHHFDVTADLGGIDLPILVVSGSEDRMVPARYSAAMVAALPAATFHAIEGAGHFVMQEKSGEVVGLLGDFLRQLPPATRQD